MANFLGDLFNFRKLGLWQKQNRSVIGVDIGTSSVKIIQLRRDKGRAILETYGEIATGPYRNLAVGQAAVLSPDKLVETLKDLTREANITTNQASIGIPLSSSLLMIIEVPKVSNQMLAKIVPIEARKYIPVPISEVALDWWAIPNQKLNLDETQNVLQVLVVAIHNSMINQSQDFSRSLGWNTDFFEIETFSAIRSVFGGEMSATAMIDLGAATSKLAIIDYGVVRLSHTIAKGAQDITLALSRSLGVDFTKAEEIKRKVGLVERFDGQDLAPTVNSILEYIFSEANRVIADYQQKQQRSVNKIILIGSGALLRGLLEVANNSFEIPVELGKPFDKVEAPAFLTNVLSEAGPGFAVSIGLALRHLQSFD